MEIVTYTRLNNDILSNLDKIPNDIDLIVGVPRSGLLVANILGLYLNKPISDIEGFIESRIFAVGRTKNAEHIITNFDDIKKVLIVEDSVDSGRSIEQVKSRIHKSTIKKEIIYLAVYICSGREECVDIYFRKIDDERVFEWNYMHHKKLRNACFDIDGVLCFDPTDAENDDGNNYLKFLENARPKLIPTRKIGYLVTSRLEKYREPTERWLEKNGIQYGRLFMMNLETAEERRKLGSHGAFKADVFGKLKDATWFVESDPSQAQEIAALTGKSVLCVGEPYAYSENVLRQTIRLTKRKVIRKAKLLLKKFLPESILIAYKKYRK